MKNYYQYDIFYTMTGEEFKFYIKKYTFSCTFLLKKAHEFGFTDLTLTDFYKWKKSEQVPTFVVVLLFMCFRKESFTMLRKEWDIMTRKVYCKF